MINNKNVERQGTTFCIFCFRSFRDFKAHYCKNQQKCYHCFRFYSKTEYSDETCSSNVCLEQQTSCLNCEKISRNTRCTQLHEFIGSKYCKLVRICNLCEKVYRTNHKCFQRMCYHCYKFHEKTDFCPLNTSTIKRRDAINILGVKSDQFLLITTLQRNKLHNARYMFYFDLKANTCSTIEYNLLSGNVIQLESNSCYIQTFDELCMYLKLDANLFYSFFLDVQMFEYFQDTIRKI